VTVRGPICFRPEGPLRKGGPDAQRTGEQPSVTDGLCDWHRRPARCVYAVLAGVLLGWITYGSLIPLASGDLAQSRAVERLFGISELRPAGQSRSDFLGNLLLFVPVGFLLMGARRADGSGALRNVTASADLILLTGLFSLGVESAQAFTPARTPSLNDVLAQAIGHAGGIILWLLVGQALTDWVRDRSPADRSHKRLSAALTVYAIGLIVLQLLPLDVTLDLSDLVNKHREGRITIAPFAKTHPSTFAAVWDYLFDLVLHAPLGVAAVTVGTGVSRRRGRVAAVLSGVALVAAIELAQVFVVSRFDDMTDLFTAGSGVLIGVLVAHPWLKPAPTIQTRVGPGAAAGLDAPPEQLQPHASG